MRNTNQLIYQLKQQLSSLEQDALHHDQQLPAQQKKMLQDIERFNSQLFIQQGAQLSPCIAQLKKDIQQLEKQLSFKLDVRIIELSCQRIQDRFTALRRALVTTNLNVNTEKQKRDNSRARYAKKQQQQHSDSGFGWIASNVMKNSHQIYQELNKHLNWATTFEQKIAEMESALANCHSTDKIRLQNEILSLHRRLGKCRQAISYIEERIQMFERPNRNLNR
ncbi:MULTISPECIES: primosomal replication protein [unclassified Shewanella]|uniref:primosomal replication protein n=1 Tax=unclassified Shewanella TaxID=196818 RepID=UPI000C84A988|nr:MULTISPECIES: primosomal replication protein [unclassified Shewanella]MDO6617799.1 primosomal replication protein [Shewanella sp. 6_MG-2023]MDO6639323.1 primosomal replication protein [Shewanella sp. 5_MG-2023]MDO6677577.1 primosomal replication protein [Shewanella sp. 4_MG-2023]MDO6774845.1 primosomal replication protein [Shewanella sp. 3_MG-2023]PMG29477.1 prepilin peptidase [Shewanella sp. 10N.286.52.C2]